MMLIQITWVPAVGANLIILESVRKRYEFDRDSNSTSIQID